MEALVTMVVLTVVLLGMAGTLTVVTHVKGDRAFFEKTLKVAKAKLSNLSNVTFDALGTGSTDDEKWIWGAPDAEIVSLADINEYLEVDDGSNAGPFIYTVHFVICHDDTHADWTTDADPEDGDPCNADVSSARPNELYCDSDQTEEGEIFLRVVAGFRDKTGRCRKVGFERLISDL